MGKAARKIQGVVKSIQTRDGEELSAVLCDDRTYGIARNGRLIESLEWNADQQTGCLSFLERFAQTYPAADVYPAGDGRASNEAPT
jgi:hypothetical protein